MEADGALFWHHEPKEPSLRVDTFSSVRGDETGLLSNEGVASVQNQNQNPLKGLYTELKT